MPPLVRRTLLVAAAAGLVAALATTIARASGSTTWVAVLLVTFTPYALVPYAVATAAAAYGLLRARGRRRAWSAASACLGVLGLVVHGLWLAPSFTTDRSGAADRAAVADGTPVTVLSVNVLRGRADPDDLARVVTEVDPDVLVLTEVEEPLLGRLDTVVPPDLARVAGSGSGLDTQVFSRFAAAGDPGDSGGATDLGLTLGAWRTDLRVGDRVVRTFAAHPYSPALRPVAWREDHERLRQAVVASRGPALVVGDLNATPDHPPLRRLAQAGVRDAAGLVGDGWRPTFPASSLLPPLIAIDHVLLRGDWGVRRVGTHRVEGTDHLGVSAELLLRG